MNLHLCGCRLAALFVALVSSACSSGERVVSDGEGETRDGGTFDAARSVCWPASLDPTDGAPNGGCAAGRALLQCTYSNGSGQICVSDDPTSCGAASQPANGTSVCQNRCQPDEYALSCGSPGFGGLQQPTPPPPPASCRVVIGIEGLSFLCCPCDGEGDGGSAVTDQ